MDLESSFIQRLAAPRANWMPRGQLRVIYFETTCTVSFAFGDLKGYRANRKVEFNALSGLTLSLKQLLEACP